MNDNSKIELSLFPLGLVLFPAMPLKLHIFEERYKKMIRWCLETTSTFGVVRIKDGQEAHGPLAQVEKIGCTMKILKLEKLSNGHFNIFGKGDQRFRILKETTSEDYMTAKIQYMPFCNTTVTSNKTPVKSAPLTQNINQVMRIYLEMIQPGMLEAIEKIEFPVDELELALFATNFLQISTIRKQQLLETRTHQEFIHAVANAFAHEINILKTIQAIDHPAPDVDGYSVN